MSLIALLEYVHVHIHIQYVHLRSVLGNTLLLNWKFLFHWVEIKHKESFQQGLNLSKLDNNLLLQTF